MALGHSGPEKSSLAFQIYEIYLVYFNLKLEV